MPPPSANPVENTAESSPQHSAESVPRHPMRMLSPPPRRGSSRLSPLPAPPRRSSLLSPGQARASARGERLAAALERGFITAKVLHTRDGGPLADFIGPLAPERYMGLPKGSKAMGKALVGVALKKGLKEVRRLETFRRSGSVRGGKGKPLEVEKDEGWFGATSRALMGETSRIEENFVNQLKGIKLGKNSGDTVRTAHIPLECLDVSSYKGVDYRSSMQPKVRKSPVMEGNQSAQIDSTAQMNEEKKTEGSTDPMEINEKKEPEKVVESRELVKIGDVKQNEKTQDDKQSKVIGTDIEMKPAIQSPTTEKETNVIDREQEVRPQSSRMIEPISVYAIVNGAAKENPPKTGAPAGCQDVVIDDTQTAINPIENPPTNVLDVDVVSPLHSPALPVRSNQSAKHAVQAKGGLNNQFDTEKVNSICVQPESGKEVDKNLDVIGKSDVSGAVLSNSDGGAATNEEKTASPMVLSYSPSQGMKTDENLKQEAKVEHPKGPIAKMDVDVELDEVGKDGQESSQDKSNADDPKSPYAKKDGKDQETTAVELKLESPEPQGTDEFIAPVATSRQPAVLSPGVAVPTSPVEYTVRKNIPKSILEEMVEEIEYEKEVKLDKEKRKHSVQSRKSAGEDVDVVNIDADDDDDPKAKPVPFARPRKIKRRRSMLAQRMDIEEKRESLRNRVVAAMSTESGSSRIVKQENRRGSYRSGAISAATAEKLKAKRSAEKGSQKYQRRTSRRLRRRSSQPLVESSQSEKSSDENDDDYIAPVDHESRNSRERARSAGGLADNSASQSDPEMKELVIGRQRRGDHVSKGNNQISKVHAKSGKRRGSSSPEISQFKRRVKKEKIEADDDDEEEEAIETGNSSPGTLGTFWERELVDLSNKMELCESPDLSSSSEDSDDGLLHEGIGIVGRLVRFHSKNGSSLLDIDQFDEHHEMMSHYRKTRSKKDAENKESKELIDGTDFVLNQFRESARLFREPKVKKFRTDTHATEEKTNEVEADDNANEVKNGPVKDNKGNVVSKGSEDGEMFSGREFRARDLYERVVSGMEEFVDEKAKELLKRWAERDHSWFDKGSPIMEVAVVTTMKQCKYCDAIDGKTNERCEESILIKLWDNMTWRKLRRMRHRVRSVSNRGE